MNFKLSLLNRKKTLLLFLLTSIFLIIDIFFIWYSLQSISNLGYQIKLFPYSFGLFLAEIILLFSFYIFSSYVYKEVQKTILYQLFIYFISSTFVIHSFLFWKLSFIDQRNVPFTFELLFQSQKTIYLYFRNSFLYSILLSFLFFILNLFSKDKLNQIIKKTLPFLYAIFVVSILSCIFSTDFFRTPIGEKSTIFFGGTEEYIIDRIEDNNISFIEDLKLTYGFNYLVDEDNQRVMYLSQTGFYGLILKLFSAPFDENINSFIVDVRVILSVIFSIIISVFSFVFLKRDGIFVSLIFTFLCAITYWIIGPSKYLIWFYFVEFLPMIFSFFAYPYIFKNEKSAKWYFSFLILFYISVFLRGYTYVTNIAISPTIIILYFGIKNKEYKRMIKHILLSGFLSVFSYFFVLLIHLIQLQLYFNDFNIAINYLLERALFRISGDSSTVTASYWSVFTNWLNVRVFWIPRINNKFFPELFEVFDRINRFSTIYIVFLVEIVITFLILYLKKIRNSKIFALVLSTIYALFGSWIWFFAKNHMINHKHMNGIMIILPYGIVFYYLTGYIVQLIIERIFKASEQ